jgi:hypothetical protein
VKSEEQFSHAVEIISLSLVFVMEFFSIILLLFGFNLQLVLCAPKDRPDVKSDLLHHWQIYVILVQSKYL